MKNDMKNNLIGISGKINSGKDSLGNMIQYLTSYGKYNSFENFMNRTPLTGGNPYEIRKYADKLKDILCMLLGCTREDLEDDNFKNKELGEEWTKWGIIREGGHKIFEVHGIELTAIVRRDLFFKGGSIEKMTMTPRKLMTLLGTDCGRNMIHPQMWVNALFADYKTKYYEGNETDLLDGTMQPVYPNWIITDCRFPNEAKAVKDRGGIVIRINRPRTISGPNKLISKEKAEHESETALDNYPDFDHVIENDGTFEELLEKVRNLNLI